MVVIQLTTPEIRGRKTPTLALSDLTKELICAILNRKPEAQFVNPGIGDLIYTRALPNLNFPLALRVKYQA